MEWKLAEIKQETNHPYLNLFLLRYIVTKDDGSEHEIPYYIASRKTLKELRVSTKEYGRPDAVIIPLYQKQEDGSVKILLSSQFRPAVGVLETACPAGIMDPTDKTPFDTARREALEEAGAIIDDLELLAPAAPTSSGLTDESNAVVLGRIVEFKETHQEEFEDIRSELVTVEELRRRLNDPKWHFALSYRLISLYLISRFGK